MTNGSVSATSWCREGECESLEQLIERYEESCDHDEDHDDAFFGGVLIQKKPTTNFGPIQHQSDKNVPCKPSSTK